MSPIQSSIVGARLANLVICSIAIRYKPTPFSQAAKNLFHGHCVQLAPGKRSHRWWLIGNSVCACSNAATTTCNLRRWQLPTVNGRRHLQSHDVDIWCQPSTSWDCKWRRPSTFGNCRRCELHAVVAAFEHAQMELPISHHLCDLLPGASLTQCP